MLFLFVQIDFVEFHRIEKDALPLPDESVDRSVGKGQVIFADGKLFLQGEDGVVGLVQPDPGEYKEVSRFEIGRGNYPTWTLPVISGGRLYIRDQELLRCYDVSQ